MFMEFRHLFVIEVALKGKKYVMNYGDKLNLTKKEVLLVAFDQSTSQTGMCVKTDKGKLVCLVDFINRGLPDNYVYQGMLKFTLKSMFEGCNIKLMVIEKPWGGIKYSFAKLSELKGFMKQLKYEIPEFLDLKIEEVYPQSWRSTFLAGPEYKGRFSKDKVKEAVREEVCVREPELCDYAYSKNRVPDSIEAYGILDGYYEKNYSESGTRIVNKTMNHNKRINLVWEIVKIKTYELKSNTKEEMIEAILLSTKEKTHYYASNIKGYCLMNYNKDLTEEENIKIACSNTDKVVIMGIPMSSCYCAYLWETGEIMKKGEAFFLTGYKKFN